MPAVPTEAKNIADVAVRVREVLELGTAALQPSSAFATAAQGTKADSAIQPAAIGVSVQAYSVNLDTLAAVTPASAGTSILALSLAADVRSFLDTAPYVATRTAAKALDTTKETTLILTEAGHEGIFNWRSGDYSAQITLDTLEGIYLKADAIASSAGAWVRVHDGLADVRWFDAVLDGTTNISASIQAALNVVGGALIPYSPLGFVAGDITLKSGQKIYSPRKTLWKTPAGASYAIRVLAFMSTDGTVLNQYAHVENFVFDLIASPTTTTAFLMGTSTQHIYGLRVINCDGKNCGSFYEEEVHATNWVVDLEFKDVNLTQTRGRQIYSRRSRGFFLFEAVRIDHTQNTDQVTWEGARFEDIIGLELNRFDVVGPTIPTSTYQAAAIGLVIDGVQAGKTVGG